MMYPMNNPMMPQYQNNIGYPYNLSNNVTMQTSLTRVTGIEGAKAYQMNANSQVALFDNNEDIMYIKVTDGAGFPTIRTFKFTEYIEDSKPVLTDDYVSKSEFETFKEEVSKYVEQFIQQSGNKNNTTSKSKSNPND